MPAAIAGSVVAEQFYGIGRHWDICRKQITSRGVANGIRRRRSALQFGYAWAKIKAFQRGNLPLKDGQIGENAETSVMSSQRMTSTSFCTRVPNVCTNGRQ